ncbi:MAG: GntR family transcriptional regulator [Lentisphaeria bacterium]|nr:GntR family transcriptional regulator [Lentisphaeria bacterium]
MNVTQRIEKIIGERIQNGIYRNGEKLPSLRQLTRELGASYVMVFRAMNNLTQRNLVISRPGAGYWVQLDDPVPFIPSDRLVYFVFSNPENNPPNEYLVELYSYIQADLRRRGYWDQAVKYDDKDVYNSPLPAGVILTDNSPLCSYFAQKGVPFVFCSNEPTESHFSSIHPDYYSGSFRITEHLIRKGVKDIVFVNCYLQDNRNSFVAREKGYRDAMLRNNLPIPASYSWHVTQAAEPLKECLLTNPPEALFVANDVMAVEIMQMAQSLGLKVPQDILIAGLEDMLCGRISNPTLTSAMYDKRELASAATQILIDQITGKENGITKKEIAMKLVIRQSTEI